MNYSQEVKTKVLELLDAQGGNVLVTSVQSGIPERTLYRWKCEQNKNNMRQITIAPPIPTSVILQDTEEVEEAPIDPAMRTEEYKHLRKKIMRYINNILAEANPDQPITGGNAISLTRLLDRLHKLDQWIDILTTQQADDGLIRIVYVNPYTGAEEDEPFYMKSDPDAPDDPYPYSSPWLDNVPPEEQDRINGNLKYEIPDIPSTSSED